MVVSKHLTHFCYPIRLVLHQHLNSHIAYPGIPPENSNHTRGQYQHLSSYVPSFEDCAVLILFADTNTIQSADTSADIALVCGLNFQVGCQDRLRVNSGANEALA